MSQSETTFKLSDEVEDLLIQAAEDETRAWRAYGLAVIKAIDQATDPETGEVKVPLSVIRDECGKRCGKAGETMRKYQEVVEYYPDQVWDQFETLHFNHFRLAMRGQEMRQSIYWLLMARDYAELPGSDGRPMPVRVMAAKMDDAGRGVNPFNEPTLVDRLDDLRWRTQKLQEGAELSPIVRSLLRKALDYFERALSAIEGEPVDVSEEVQNDDELAEVTSSD